MEITKKDSKNKQKINIENNLMKKKKIEQENMEEIDKGTCQKKINKN